MNPFGKSMISAVVFIAFGTLVDLQSKRHPFMKLLKEGIVGAAGSARTMCGC
jgi:hypothetical protein